MTDPGREPTPNRDWTALWEAAAAATVSGSVDGRVYTGPAWETPNRDTSLSARVWKLAVLERRPEGGAEHWGHMLLVLGKTPSKVVIQPERPMLGGPDPPAVETLPALSSVPWEVRIRPRSAETASRLRAFALEFQRCAERLTRAEGVPGTAR
ncbi:MAG: hypothetical protein L3K14_05580 [Thermoplasmata archaeon]|nr:hypothetical protein [Thermoplasmata archaeon]